MIGKVYRDYFWTFNHAKLHYWSPKSIINQHNDSKLKLRVILSTVLYWLTPCHCLDGWWRSHFRTFQMSHNGGDPCFLLGDTADVNSPCWEKSGCWCCLRHSPMRKSKIHQCNKHALKTWRYADSNTNNPKTTLSDRGVILSVLQTTFTTVRHLKVQRLSAGSLWPPSSNDSSS